MTRFGSQKIGFMLTDVKREDLLFLKELIEAGQVNPVIDRRYPLSEVPDAIRYLETMRARGKSSSPYEEVSPDHARIYVYTPRFLAP